MANSRAGPRRRHTPTLAGLPLPLNVRQEAHLVTLHRAGEHSVAELSDLFGVTRSTVYRAIQRDAARQRAAAPERQGPVTKGFVAGSLASTRRR